MQQTPSANAVEVRANAGRAPQPIFRETHTTNATTAPTVAQDEHFPLGAHIVTPRRWYTHHGIYVGAGQVVHYDGLSSSLRRGPVAKVSLVEFSNGYPVCLHNDVDVTYSSMEIAARACSRIGEDAYDVLRNNCEHFCSWCLTGVARSPQVERLLLSSPAVALTVQLLACCVNGWSTARDALLPLIS
ncbi:lecithin retinol acyltransferase family protein [Paraburkholderia guartelaensis]|uniref:lecithin retinol acyltransferase family protein n=1 Tax=Paraburkholderia guartelaensis TaxID=2546446 RepID=UPI002AB6ED82|nr:lecithin retinol acyltransferase family protein [Paraburkholderia guartelaensis]